MIPLSIDPEDVRAFLADYDDCPLDIAGNVSLGATRPERKLAYAILSLLERQEPDVPEDPPAPAPAKATRGAQKE